jgi:hypothetical protein
MAGVNDVDPRAAHNSSEFVQLMRRLIVAAGKPSVRELSRKADAIKAGSLPHSTLAEALRKESLPAWRVVDSLISVCGVAPGPQGRWRASWERLAAQAEGVVIEETAVREEPKDRQTKPPLPENRRTLKPLRPDQSDEAALEVVSWLKRTLIRPNAYRGETRTAVVEISNLSAVDPYQARQFSKENLRPGDSIRCWMNQPLLEHKTLYYAFASGESADELIAAELPRLYRVRIKCLGQIRTIESTWVPFDDEERGISYDTAYLLELVRQQEGS